MRLSDIDILIVPGWTNSGPDHWQSRWQRNMKAARRVEQVDWDRPQCRDWELRIIEAARQARRPTVLVAHGCGGTAVAKAAPELAATRVAGAFLVAVPDFAAAHDAPAQDGPAHDIWPARNGGFTPLPMATLPFPTKLIGSSTDPFCSLERAQEIGKAWGSDVSIIAGAGHLDTASGHGPWPEGLLTFGLFLRKLGLKKLD